MSAGLLTIDYIHEKGHSAKVYRAGSSSNGDLADAASMILLIKCKGNTLHSVFVGGSEGNARALFYEGNNISANGTVITPRVLNRKYGSDSNCTASFYLNPTVATLGATLIDMYMLGGEKNKSIGAEGRAGEEWILNENTNYIMKVINQSGGGALVWFATEFYEE